MVGRRRAGAPNLPAAAAARRPATPGGFGRIYLGPTQRDGEARPRDGPGAAPAGGAARAAPAPRALSAEEQARREVEDLPDRLRARWAGGGGGGGAGEGGSPGASTLNLSAREGGGGPRVRAAADGHEDLRRWFAEEVVGAEDAQPAGAGAGAGAGGGGGTTPGWWGRG